MSMATQTPLEYYHKINRVNDLLLAAYRFEPKVTGTKWMVTELLDGDHLALYADYAKNIYKAASRNRFVYEDDHYGAANEIAFNHKAWLMEFSKSMQQPVVVYGTVIGGSYYGNAQGIPIIGKVQYSPINEFFIHDVKLNYGFVPYGRLELMAQRFGLDLAPPLYEGSFSTAICYPENKLSYVPFMRNLKPNYKNEMKGIVVRPVVSIVDKYNKPFILKKLNRKLDDSRIIGPKPKLHLTETLNDIAEHIMNEAMLENILDYTLTEIGAFDLADLSRVAGVFVQNILNNVAYVKYTLATNKEKNLINKELHRLAVHNINAILNKDAA